MAGNANYISESYNELKKPCDVAFLCGSSKTNGNRARFFSNLCVIGMGGRYSF